MHARQPLLLAATSIVLLAAVAAQAKTIDVAPGPGTPLQDAIDAAAPKDRIRVQSGTYAETIVVNKPLRIAAKDGARIDGGCTVPTTVAIASDDVRLEGFSVRGATFSQVEIGPHHKVFVRVGGVPDCAGVQHGIRAVGVKQLTIKSPSYFQFDTSGGTLGCHKPLTPNERLYEDAAVYVTGTQLGAKVRISEAFMCLVSTGIRLENIVRGPKTPRPVVLQRNTILASYRGILLQNTDGTAVQSSRIDSLQPGAIAGIELDAASSDNVLAQNRIEGFPADVVDAGASNCWRLTTYATGTLPSGGCP